MVSSFVRDPQALSHTILTTFYHSYYAPLEICSYWECGKVFISVYKSLVLIGRVRD